MPRTPFSQPVVASSGESEETTDSGRGSCEDVTVRYGGGSQRNAMRTTGQTLNLPLRLQSSDTGNSFVVDCFSFR